MATFVASATAINPATTSASSLTVNKPTGTLDGHLMVMIVSCSAAQTLTTPTGWTLVRGPFDSNTGVRSYMFKKRAASEGTNYTLTFAGSEACSVSIATFSSASDISMYNVLDTGSGDPVSGNSIYPSMDNLLYTVVAWRDTTINTASASGVTEAFDIGQLGTGSVNARGQAGYYDASSNDAYAVNGGPQVDITNSITASVVWTIAIGTSVAANESWNATGNAVEIQTPAGVYTDVTGDVLYEQGINITRGTSSQGGQVNPSVATFRLNNNSGNYSPRNPLGTFYGAGYNTQCRISKTFGDICYQTPGFDNIVPSSAESSRVETATTAALDITGDIDIRIECEPESWNQSQLLMSKWSSNTLPDSSWMFNLTSDGALQFTWNNSTTVNSVTSDAVVPTVIRQYLRVTLDVDNGASGNTATFYTSTDGSSWTQLGNSIVTTTATAIATSFTSVTIGNNSPIDSLSGGMFNASEFGPLAPLDFILKFPTPGGFTGKIYNASIRNGIAGTVVASPTFTAAANGSYSLTDSQSNLWIVHGPGVFTNRHYRHHGEITSWPQPRTSEGNFAWVDIESSGPMQREQQGTEDNTSLMYQYYTNPDGINLVTEYTDSAGINGPIFPQGYWPCEDEGGSDTVSSALSGGVDADIDGEVEFASGDFYQASKPLLKITNGAAVTFTTPNAVPGPGGGLAVSGWSVDFLLDAPSGMTVPSDIAHIAMTGDTDMRLLRFVYSGTNQVSASIYDVSGTLLDNDSFQPMLISERKTRISIRSIQGVIGFSAMTLGDQIETQSALSLVAPSGDSGAIRSLTLEPNHADGVYIGHVAIFDGSYIGRGIPGGLTPRQNDPLNGLNAERPDRRAKRIIEYREMVPYMIGNSNQKMGRQYPDTAMGTIRQCQDTDNGYVYEPRNFLGLGYRTIASMYNTAPVLELDYAGNQLSGTFNPLIDNQGVVNDMTVNNINLGSGRYTKTSGANNISRPPDGAGRYSSSADISLYASSSAVSQAAWRVFIGTNDELKIDQVTVALENLNYNTGDAAIQKLLTADIGDTMTIDNLPDLLMPDQMSQLIVGYSETFDQFQHSITFNTVPASPYMPGETTPDGVSNIQTAADSEQTTLNEDLTTTETGVDVAIAAGSALWTTSGVDFDIMIGGERMTVTSVSGSSSPQTFTCTRSVNGVVKTHSTGASVKLFKPRHAGL